MTQNLQFPTHLPIGDNRWAGREGQDNILLATGTTRHVRLTHLKRTFRACLAPLWLQLDRLPKRGALSYLVRRNQFGVFSFYDTDRGARGRDFPESEPQTCARNWFTERPGLAELATTGKIWLLTTSRFSGIGFNPISLWFLTDNQGNLRAVMFEVRNFHVGMGHYLCDLSDEPEGISSSNVQKHFPVSSFQENLGDYLFRFHGTLAAFNLSIRHRGPDGRDRLFATYLIRSQPFSDMAFLKGLRRVRRC